MTTLAARRADLRIDLLVALGFAVFAFVVHEFQFNRSNNFYHIPIVLDWHRDPLFADDPFVTALQTYATPFYFLLRPVTDADNVALVFHLLFAACRGLTLFAMIQLARAVGLADARLVVAFALIVAAAKASYGSSPVGDGTLFTNYMTHSEFAQAFAILGIAWAIAGRPAASGAAAGLAFATNAFIGIWTLFPVGVVALLDMLRDGKPALRRWLVAAACFAVPALPVVGWILLTQDGAAETGFSYREFLQFYYGAHFFIGWSDWPQRFTLFSAMMAAGVAATLLLPQWRPLVVVSCTANLFAAGVMVGEKAQSRLLLNLHLLRSDGLMIWLAIGIVAAASLPRLLRGPLVTRIGALTALAGLLLGAWPLVLAGMLLQAAVPLRIAIGAGAGTQRLGTFVAAAQPMASAADATPRSMAPLAIAVAVIAVFAWTLPALRTGPDAARGPSLHDLEGSDPRVSDWLNVKRWAAGNTPAEARFLIPPEFSDFLTGTRRRIWVSQAEGAPVMWAPHTYADWRRRLDETAALQTEQEALAYARRNGLDYVVFDKRPRRRNAPVYEVKTPAVFENRWFAVVPVPR